MLRRNKSAKPARSNKGIFVKLHRSAVVIATTVLSLAFTVANTGGGNNSGWRVNAAATQFLNGTNAFPTTASSVVTVPNPGSCTGGGCNTPTPSGLVVYPVTLPTTGGVAIYNASANTGKGTNVMTATVRVTAPANIIAGTYTSTVTLQVVSGP